MNRVLPPGAAAVCPVRRPARGPTVFWRLLSITASLHARVREGFSRCFSRFFDGHRPFRAPRASVASVSMFSRLLMRPEAPRLDVGGWDGCGGSAVLNLPFPNSLPSRARWLPMLKRSLSRQPTGGCVARPRSERAWLSSQRRIRGAFKIPQPAIAVFQAKPAARCCPTEAQTDPASAGGVRGAPSKFPRVGATGLPSNPNRSIAVALPRCEGGRKA